MEARTNWDDYDYYIIPNDDLLYAENSIVSKNINEHLILLMSGWNVFTIVDISLPKCGWNI